MRAPLSVSAVAHAAIIGLLLALPAVAPRPPKLDLSHAVEVVFAPPPAPAPPQPAVAPPPPPPPPQAVEQPPAPPAVRAEAPPPPPKPAPKPRPKPAPQAVERPPEMPLPLPTATVPAAPQVAALPPQAPAISADYRATLSGWLESHKHYPEAARQRGEEGRAVLRFRVDRTGRVLDYAVVSSTGFADLDAAVESMMRGATMPPFPPGMTAPEIEVSVAIRFGLTR